MAAPTSEMIQIHKDVSSLTKAVVWATGMLLAYKYEIETGARAVYYDVCSKEEEDFVTKLKSEADRRGIRGFVKSYSKCCVKGVIEAPRADLDEMKAWITSNSTPADRNAFRGEKSILQIDYEDFEIRKAS